MLKPLPIDRSAADAKISVIIFIAHVGFDTQELAHMLDSLVRVSRRDEWNNFVTEDASGRCHEAQRSHNNVADREPHDSATSRQRYSTSAGPTRNIRAPAGELPCPWSYPHQHTGNDIQGKKHRTQPDHNLMHHMR